MDLFVSKILSLLNLLTAAFALTAFLEFAIAFFSATEAFALVFIGEYPPVFFGEFFF